MLSRKQPSAYAPSTLAADVHRLLDPHYAYAARSSLSSASTTSSSPTSLSALGDQPRAYVDHAGEAHDPDYRDFPGMPAPQRHTPRRTSLSPARAYRPAWERAFEPEEMSDDEEPARYCAPYGLRRVSSGAMLSRTRSDSGSSSGQPPAQLYNFTHRASFEEEHEYEMEEDDEEEEVSCEQPQQHKSSHTTSEAIKYQMTALSMRVQFSVFRAKRRWRERRKSSSSG